LISKLSLKSGLLWHVSKPLCCACEDAQGDVMSYP
jgi:hypothetical protein